MTALGRPRKVVPDVVNVFPHPPGNTAQDHSQDIHETFPLSGGVNEEPASSSRGDPLVPQFPSTEEVTEEDMQAVSHAERAGDADTIAGAPAEKPSPSSPPLEEEEHHATFDPIPSSSSPSSSFSKPEIPANMVGASLGDEHDDSMMREPTQLTAIFRPDGAWREKLRAAHEEEVQRQQRQQQQQQGMLRVACDTPEWTNFTAS
jgi:hypothetical protein